MRKNPSAFPYTLAVGTTAFVGMTLRDYFAAKELAKTIGPSICDMPGAYEELAVHCYKMADAMLEARKSDEV